ncbi:cupin domain-containing protein [bacterium]|nr:cupin domain-containing protein [candidate division CSSED10-310 bacterium]
MERIKIERNVSKGKLDKLNVISWPIWAKENSEFPWHYDKQEICFFIEGHAIVTPDNGEPVEMGEGDLVTFPAGLSCMWKITKPVKKHYNFE